MRDSVPSTRYSSVCNVLRQWNISLIPTYRVYTDSMILGIRLRIMEPLFKINCRHLIVVVTDCLLTLEYQSSTINPPIFSPSMQKSSRGFLFLMIYETHQWYHHLPRDHPPPTFSRHCLVHWPMFHPSKQQVSLTILFLLIRLRYSCLCTIIRGCS